MNVNRIKFKSDKLTEVEGVLKVKYKIEDKPNIKDAKYINNPMLLNQDVYGLINEYEEESIIDGITSKDGGILPDDNIRIYVPVDLNEDMLLMKLRYLFVENDDVDWTNEVKLSIKTEEIINQLRIYDKLLLSMNKKKKYSFVNEYDGIVVHSLVAKRIAKKMIKILYENEGSGDFYPYESIAMLEEEYGLPESLDVK